MKLPAMPPPADTLTDTRGDSKDLQTLVTIVQYTIS